MNKHVDADIKSFLTVVKAQIHSKEARQFVEAELLAHLQQRKKAYLAQGFTEEESEELAVKQFGNPVTLGKEMHNIHKPKVDWWMLGLLLVIICLGIISIYFTTLSEFPNGLNGRFVQFQFIFSLIAIFALTCMMLLDYRKLAKFWPVILAVGVILSLLLFQAGTLFNGRPYLDIGSFRIGFWVISLLFLVSFAGLLCSSKWNGMSKVLIVTTVIWLPAFLMYIGNHASVMILYVITCFGMVVASPLKRKSTFYTLNSVLLVIGIILTISTFPPHQLARLLGFLHPEEYASSDGYFYIVTKQLFQEATFWGNRGGSLHEFGFATHTDLVFPFIVYQMGWGYAGILLLTIIAFLVRIVQVIKKTSDPFGTVLVVGAVMMIGLATIWNIGMVFGLLPIVGISLPFISYGGSFFLLYGIYVGLILSVYRRKDLVQATG